MIMENNKEIEKFLKNKIYKSGYNTSDQNKENINRVLYSGPYWDNKEVEAVINTIINGKWMSSGENVYKFENKFAKKYNQKSGVMVNSGSSANLILITAMKKYFGWKDGDEIIVSPVGFPTTIAPIIQNNLVPKFVDIEFDSLNFDLNKLNDPTSFIFGPKTRAVFLSPVLGNSVDLSLLLQMINNYNKYYTNNDVKLILDSCDSLGSKWKDKYLDEYAFASSYSFYPAHHITTMEGGMITSNDEDFIKLARSFAWWGRDCYCVGSANLLQNGTCGHRFDKWIENLDCIIDHKYVFNNIGYNLKPLDLQGAIGLEQLKKIDKIHILRKQNKKIIQKIFEEELNDLIYIPVELPDAETSWFGVPIIVKNKNYKTSLVNHLEKNGIQTRNYFAGNILLHSGYKHLDNYRKYPNANRVLDEVFFIGCHPSYNKKTFNYIRKVIKNGKNKINTW